MSVFCPNKNNKHIKAEFDELVEAVKAAGHDDAVAYLIWHKTEGEGLGNHPGLTDSDDFKRVLESVNGDRKTAIMSLANKLLSKNNSLQQIKKDALNKDEVSKLRLRTRSYNILHYAQLVTKHNGRYYIQSQNP